MRSLGALEADSEDGVVARSGTTGLALTLGGLGVSEAAASDFFFLGSLGVASSPFSEAADALRFRAADPPSPLASAARAAFLLLLLLLPPSPFSELAARFLETVRVPLRGPV